MPHLCRADSQRHVFNQHYRISAHQYSNFEFPTILNFSTTTFKLESRFKFVMFPILPYFHSHRSWSATLSHSYVFSSFRCRPLPTFPMWKFLHRWQRSASAWERDFVNVPDRFSLDGTLSTSKRPSCTCCCTCKKRTSTCRVFPNPCRADTPLAALQSPRM